MSARIDVVNIALSWLGVEPITSLEDDAPEALLMKNNYYIARDATLEAHEWSFAIKRFKPAMLIEAPIWGARYQFAVPSDIIRVLHVETDHGGLVLNSVYNSKTIDRRPEVDWLLESGNILTNEESIVCRGIRRVEDEGEFTPLFSHAFAAHLAMLCTYAISESNIKFNAMSALYLQKIQAAKTRDGLQGSGKRLRNRSLQNVR